MHEIQPQQFGEATQDNTPMVQPPQKPSKVIWVVGGLVVFTILAGGFFALNRYIDTKKQAGEPRTSVSQIEDSIIDDTLTVIDDKTITFRLQNFVLEIEPGWQKVSSEEVMLPENLSSPYFALNKEGTQCVFAYINTSTDSVLEYRQIYPGERVFTVENRQIDSWWYVPRRDLSEDFQVSFGTGPSRRREVRIVWYPFAYNNPDPNFSNVFVLFSRDGGTVSRDCDSNVSAMLTSIVRTFELTTLTSQSEGVAYIQQKSGIPTQLMFVAQGNVVHKEIAQLGNIPYAPSPIVSNNKIIFTTNGILKEIDIFSGNSIEIPGIVSAQYEIVNDFFLAGQRFFYLFGENCQLSYDDCNLKLYEYSFDTNESEFLVDGVTTFSIIGYDEKKNILGMVYKFGDAGCFSTQAEQYNFSTRELTKEGRVSGCEGEAPSELTAEEKEYMEFKERFPDVIVTYDYMIISNGKIIAPLEPLPYTGNRLMLRYVD